MYLQSILQGFHKVSEGDPLTALGSCQAGASGTLGFARFHKGFRKNHDSDPEPCEMGCPLRIWNLVLQCIL